MRSIFRTFPPALFALALLVFCSALSAQGQSRDEKVISAQGGGVNFVSGDVSVRRKGETKWQELTSKDDIKPGDVVRTGSFGRIEVLLNPGSYMRLDENSEFAFASVTPGDMRIKLGRGSVVIEAVSYGGDPGIAIKTPHTVARIIKGGIYRVDVLSTTTTEVRVREGRAVVGVEPATTLVRGGHVARVSTGGVVELAKFDKKLRDDLDEWSRERGKSLAKANQNMRRRTMNTLLASYRTDDVLDIFQRHGRYSNFGPSGAWVYLPELRCYTFVPFYGGFSSPYGHRYPNMLGWAGPGPVCNGCRGNQPNRPVIVSNSTGNGVGTLAGNGNGGGNGAGNGTGTGGGGSAPGVSNPQPAPSLPPAREVFRPEPPSRQATPSTGAAGRVLETRDN